MQISAKVAFTFAFSTLLAGCITATRPVPYASSRRVTADRILATPSGATNSVVGGKIVVVRDSGFLGSGHILKISIDGCPVARLKQYERYEVYLKEGEYILSVLPEPNLVATSTETAVDVKRAHTYTFRTGFDQAGIILQRSTLSGR